MSANFPNRVVNGLKASSKKQVLQEAARVLAEVTGLHERAIFDVLVERERLGSTGMGAGVAIPHGRIAGINQVYEVFIRLDKPVDYDALDSQPVDLVYALLAPMEAGADHLKSLARASRILRDTPMCAKLRGSNSEAALQLLLQSHPAASAA